MSKKKFAGNGLSRTAMIFKIATIAGHKLTVPEMNKIKEVNPRNLERVYDHIANGGGKGDAQFALTLIFQ
jgi:hypothetical protein